MCLIVLVIILGLISEYLYLNNEHSYEKLIKTLHTTQPKEKEDASSTKAGDSPVIKKINSSTLDEANSK